MSLTLIQGYSSPEEEEESEEEIDDIHLQNSSDEEDDNKNDTVLQYPIKPLFNLPDETASSSLPSALDAFAEVSGPPQFLNNCVEEPITRAIGDDGQQWRHGRRRNRKEKKDLPAGVVVEAKPQLVGIHERVRSDMEGGSTPASSKEPSNTSQGGKRVATVANPSAQDAAELLRMCLQCGVPKTFSNAKGMVCPICGDRPPADPNDESAKKKSSTVKDKEKNKRMKGQSSHATWKSETEMLMRQQFD